MRNSRPLAAQAAQLCQGDLIRHRTVTGICNDIRNPLMGSTNQPFARNVEFEETFPRLGRTELVRNRHGDRLGLLKPDPQVISRVLFTREQSDPEKCREGQGLPGYSHEARCDYKPAPFFNVLAAFWIQFMNHDWFSHLSEGRNDPKMMRVGCTHKRVDGVDRVLTAAEQRELGCRPEDRMDTSLYAKTDEPGRFSSGGKTYLARAPRTTANTVTAWWDASQLYGYDEPSRQRVKRDPDGSGEAHARARACRQRRAQRLPAVVRGLRGARRECRLHAGSHPSVLGRPGGHRVPGQLDGGS